MSLTLIPGVAIVLISEVSLTDFWNRLAQGSTGILDNGTKKKYRKSIKRLHFTY